MPSPSPTVFLNGEYIPSESATVSVDDRGFMFADACYEVTAVFGGRCLALDRHLDRLQRSLDALRIGFTASTLVAVHEELIERNGLTDSELASVYAHVTRGVAARAQAFPVNTPPTVFVRAQAITGPSPDVLASGVSAITQPDIRWGRVDIKSTGLLANVLAQQRAIDEGADDVILHRAEFVTEGSHTNVFGVVDGVVVTAPSDRHILSGVTRGILLELAGAAGIGVEERTWTLGEMRASDEVLMTSTTSGVRPIVAVDGRPIGDGRRGPVTERLQELYRSYAAEQCGR